MASLEHLSLQAYQPETAEQYAFSIPEVPSECALAKAEGLSAAASAWLAAENTDRAQTAFAAARQIVQSIRDLPLGRVSVMITIAKAQAKNGMVASGAESLKLALQYAEELPLQPAAFNNPRSTTLNRVRYRNEAYKNILVAAIQLHDLGSARRVAEAWHAADEKASYAIVNSWLEAGERDEALSFVRKIKDKPAKSQNLLAIAQHLLEEAGAPNF